MHLWHGKNIKVNILYSRAGVAQHIWIMNKNGALLIDSGDGALRDILAHKLHPKQIKGIVYTHGHFDHVGGLHSLLGFMRMIQRKAVLPIFAPKGCAEVFSVVDNFEKLYGKTIPFKISRKEIKPHTVFNIARMRVKAYPVVHHGSIEGKGILAPIPAFGYRISYKNEIVAISGDTGLSSSLKSLVKGADLAVLEATFKTSKDRDEYLMKVHLSEDAAKKIGRLAKKFILVHKANNV